MLVVDSVFSHFCWLLVLISQEALSFFNIRSVYAYTFNPSFNAFIYEFSSFGVESEGVPEMRNRIVIKLEREENESAWLKVSKNDNPRFACCLYMFDILT